MCKIENLGKMLDPFKKEDGTRMSLDEWYAKRDELREFIVDFEYGGMPPRPEIVRYELISETYDLCGDEGAWYKVIAGSKERQLSFLLNIVVPSKPDLDKGNPVLLTGDGCYRSLELETVVEAKRRGYVVARFNRLELANDVSGLRKDGLYDVYPDNQEFTAISAWAWGYMVVVDVLEKLPFADATEVGITGHSRGGKTVLLAATVDERIQYVCPNNSGLHGAVSYRTIVSEQGESKRRTERLSDMCTNVPHWMGPKLFSYIGREEELPYDMHYFGALIAPRYYLQCEGMQDYWINPIGSWQNFMAVKECYRYLGCKEHAAAWFRPGGHRHRLPDFTEFMNFMDRARAGLPVSEHLCVNPYPEIERNFEW